MNGRGAKNGNFFQIILNVSKHFMEWNILQFCFCLNFMPLQEEERKKNQTLSYWNFIEQLKVYKKTRGWGVLYTFARKREGEEGVGGVFTTRNKTFDIYGNDRGQTIKGLNVQMTLAYLLWKWVRVKTSLNGFTGAKWVSMCVCVCLCAEQWKLALYKKVKQINS